MAISELYARRPMGARKALLAFRMLDVCWRLSVCSGLALVKPVGAGQHRKPRDGPGCLGRQPEALHLPVMVRLEVLATCKRMAGRAALVADAAMDEAIREARTREAAIVMV